MCEKILEFARIEKFKVNKNPDKEKGDLAILLSESKVNMKSLPIKLNTFKQIKESIIKVSEYSHKEIINEKDLKEIFSNYPIAIKWLYQNEETTALKEKNSKINLKVYTKFLKDIAEDMNFNITKENYDYLVFPDYLKDKINEKDDLKLIEIPTHKNTSKDPIKRAEIRYEILESITHK
ncbi:MAG: hypothetical protein KO202_07220 [Methanobacteriaceae archaeon]|nr:hypothetical protein [Methanobacteriaceae archaeon]